jgi:hypothetical protein
MSTAQDIIDRARRLINDEVSSFASTVCWANDELLSWITDAQRAVVELKPEANAITQALTPQAGRPRQTLSWVDAVKLIRVEANGNETAPDECSLEPETEGTVTGYFLTSEAQAGFGSYDPDLVSYTPVDEDASTLTDAGLLISEISSDVAGTGFFIFELSSLDIEAEVPQISSVSVQDCEADTTTVFSIDDEEVFDPDGSTGVDDTRDPPIAFRLYKWSIEEDVLQADRCYEISIVERDLN